ncbi:MAG TPA: enoyl-CoA hydratase-related protein [Cyclobacteriaceae bacterium]|nr:enoyl-CoA hydratase-related protein [Cyclobacteriaceae bacterium]
MDIHYAVNDRIASITLNRPEKRNALSPELIAGLKEAFQQAATDDRVKVVILKANGDSFCAGADLAYLQKLQHFSYEENLADSLQLKELFLQIYSFKKIVIAQVQGAALAGGCGLVTVCDLCFSSPDAMFGYTEVKIGFVPALVAVFLLRKFGEAQARNLLLTGTVFTPDEMKRIGIVTDVFSKDALSEEVEKFTARLIRSNSNQAMMLTKKMLTDHQSDQLNESLIWAAELNATARNSDDCRRGIAAFLNKQKMDWTAIICLGLYVVCLS